MQDQSANRNGSHNGISPADNGRPPLVESRPAAPKQAEVPVSYAKIDPARASDEFLLRIPIEFARDRLVVSQGVNDTGEEILVVSGRDGDCVVTHNISVRLERPCVTMHADGEAIAAVIDELGERAATLSRPGESTDDTQQIDLDDELLNLAELGDEDLTKVLEAGERDLLLTAGRAPVVRLINGLLFEALQRRASDVHVQPAQDHTLVRYRVDGVLAEARMLPLRLLLPVISRVKVMANMDIAERRLPQDGRATVTIGDKEIDLRVSSLPTAGGERVVIRLLDKRHTDMFSLDRLGMPADARRIFASICQRPYGMVLVTGPTGSGKTTTLYSVLRSLDVSKLNIMTLEDPIEYELAGISQSQINMRKGVTFATGLRHILRQDPDVIMVGEIRDAETARTAVQSSLTGHLVFSTLHTNSAASCVVRLSDLGVEPYLINASLAAVLAQRLVRTVCDRCQGVGCDACLASGFRGRTGLYELLVMNEHLKECVAHGATVGELQSASQRAGMRTLREAGDDAVQGGLTTREEVDRVTLMETIEVNDTRDHSAEGLV